MTTKEGYKKLRAYLDQKEKEGFHLNSCCIVIADHKEKTWSCFANTAKEPMARSLAALFLDDAVMWKAFKYANRLALQEQREKKKEEENGGK